ncbi:hypothetical protein [Reichenbachiella agariperforans]|uniref:hypothetical protein n=1 Tax=Reichenbachiella agariperforans TaxID=156994 RepID=UPI001114FDB9|nr:hypothetical protein [Reichenbachiella agariperforans]
MKFEIGRVSVGNEYKHYVTFGPALGVDFSAGTSHGIHQNKDNNERFDFESLKGWGSSSNYSIGAVDISTGRNNIFSTPFLPNWISNKAKPSYYSKGFGGSIGLPLGYTYGFDYTWTF